MLWHTIDSSSFISLGAFAYFPLSSTNLEHYPKWFDSSLYRPLKRRVARLGFPVRRNPLEDSGSMAAWCFVGKDKATPLPTHPSSDVHQLPEFPLRSSGTVPYTCPIPLVIFSINIPPSDTTTFSHYQLINFLTIRWVILPSSMSNTDPRETHTDLNSIKAMIFSLKAWPIRPLVYDTGFAYTSLVVGLVVFFIIASNWQVGGSRADQVIQYNSMLANQRDVDIPTSTHIDILTSTCVDIPTSTFKHQVVV